MGEVGSSPGIPSLTDANGEVLFYSTSAKNNNRNKIIPWEPYSFSKMDKLKYMDSVEATRDSQKGLIR